MSFHKSCPDYSRLFFENFDLLPPDVKKILYNKPDCPTLADIREALAKIEKENWGKIMKVDKQLNT